MSTVLTLYDAIMSSAGAQAQRFSLSEGSTVQVHMLGESLACLTLTCSI